MTITFPYYCPIGLDQQLAVAMVNQDRVPTDEIKSTVGVFDGRAPTHRLLFNIHTTTRDPPRREQTADHFYVMRETTRFDEVIKPSVKPKKSTSTTSPSPNTSSQPAPAPRRIVHANGAKRRGGIVGWTNWILYGSGE